MTETIRRSTILIEPKHPLPPPAERLAMILAQIERRLSGTRREQRRVKIVRTRRIPAK